MSLLVYPERIHTEEEMDDPSRGRDELEVALRHIDLLNSLFFGFSVINRRLRKLFAQHDLATIKVLDVGCGSGKHLRQIRKIATREDVDFSGVGVDISPAVIAVANAINDPVQNDIKYREADALALPFNDNSFDVVVASLFFHHLTDAQAVKALKELNRVGRIVIINDLVRSKFAYWGLKVLTRVFPFCAMVRNDGPISVKRSFIPADFENIARASGVDLTVRRVPLFRIMAENVVSR